MKTINELKMEFLSVGSNEAFARAAVGAFLAEQDPDLETLGDIKTAVSEAVTNCIVHGYREGAGTITLICKIYEDQRIEIVISDLGVGIPDISAARQPLYTTGGSERSGMGFTIMERFMDQLEVVSQVDQGTTVTMCRSLKPRRKHP